MRAVVFLIAVGVLTGCNLFEPVANSNGNEDGGTTDPTDADDGDAGVDDDARTDDVSTDEGDTDIPYPDVDTGDCVPETNAELCDAYAADCGDLLVPAENAATTRYEAEDLPQNSCGAAGEGLISLCSSSHWVEATHTFESDGTFRVRVGARGDTPSLVEPRVSIDVDGEEIARAPLRPNEIDVVERDLEFTAGDHVIRVQFLNDGYDAEIGDRNADADFIEVEGPLTAPVDRCGVQRAISCGGCSDGESCGRMHVRLCECICPLADGCAAVGPHPDDPCLTCTAGGWEGAAGACADDGDACTMDQCNSSLGACGHEAITCTAGQCETATCNPSTGMCETTTAPDGSTCGAMGVCEAGMCGCPDGTTVENQCGNGADEDCDGDVDCADSDCDGRNCGMGMSCTAGVCQ